MIVDAHVHLFPSEDVGRQVLDGIQATSGVGYFTTGTPDQYRTDMQRCGIDYGVMLSFAPDRQIKNNNFWTVAITCPGRNRPAAYPKLIPFCSVSPTMKGRSPVEELEMRLKWGLRGVKVHPIAQGFAPDDARMRPVYQWLVDHNLPLTTHTGVNIVKDEHTGLAHPDRWLGVLAEFPRLRLTLAHMGGGFWEDTLRLCRQYPHVLLDTAISICGLRFEDGLDDAQAVEMIRAVGAERVMFGSDYPWIDPLPDIERIRGLALDQSEIDLILGGNAARELGLS